jgi:hypothetical protein
MTAPPSIPTSQRFDLRRTEVDDALDRVERSLQTQLEPEGSVRKRRSIGARTARGTWVRIELRGLERLDGQGWGIEAAALLRGVSLPDWHSGVSWLDPERGAMWRVDETSLVHDSPVGRAAAALDLPDSWWTAFDDSLASLAGHSTTRMATPDCEPITQERVSTAIDKVFPGEVDSTIEEWAPAHADLNWSNLTSPKLWILDWEDWGMAPRGLDAACLWSASLAVPGIAERIHQTRLSDLESRTGRIMALFYCAQRIALGEENDPALERAKREALRLTTELRNSAKPS